MNGIDTYLEENGVGLAIGMLLGLGFVIAILVMAAVSDRRPPDKKDGP